MVYNEDPKPFIWTKCADEILDSLKKHCEGILAQDTKWVASLW